MGLIDITDLLAQKIITTIMLHAQQRFSSLEKHLFVKFLALSAQVTQCEVLYLNTARSDIQLP